MSNICRITIYSKKVGLSKEENPYTVLTSLTNPYRAIFYYGGHLVGLELMEKRVAEILPKDSRENHRQSEITLRREETSIIRIASDTERTLWN